MIPLSPAQQTEQDLEGSLMREEGLSPLQKLKNFLVGQSPREQLTSQFGGQGFGSIGILPERVGLARAINKQGLRGPWFHGTKAEKEILGPRKLRPYQYRVLADTYGPETANYFMNPGKQGGFNLNKVGEKTGHYFGEPAGVSLTRDPQVARGFGNLVRVGVDIPPSSVGEFVDPEFQRLFKDAYQYTYENAKVVPTTAGMQPLGKKWRDMQEWQEQLSNYVRKMDFDEFLTQYPIRIDKFNRELTSQLRNKGVEAIRYNPKRYEEFELRVLDPQKAVPLGKLPPHSYTTPNPILTRYLEGKPSIPFQDTLGGGFEVSDPIEGGFTRLRQQLLQQAPKSPIHLRDIIPELGR